MTIEKARAFIQAAGYSGVYDGQLHGVSASATGVFGEDLGHLLELGETFKDVPGGTSAWKFRGDANYLADEDLNVPVIIFPREITLPLTLLRKNSGHLTLP